MGRSHQDNNGVPSSFWLGAGIGFLLSTVAVVAAVEFTDRRRRHRSQGPQGIALGPADLVDDLSFAVQEGLSVLAEAAKQISYTFGDARRELVRFGLDAGEDGKGVGSSGDAWYFDEEEHGSHQRETEPGEVGRGDEQAGIHTGQGQQ